jgi:hypothetical protein
MTDPKTLPSHMIRPSDDEVFILANDGKYYVLSLLTQFPEHAHQGHLYETLKCYRFKPATDGLLGPRAIFTVTFL